MPIINLNVRQITAAYNIAAKRKGRTAAQFIRRLREVFDMDTIEYEQEAVFEKMSELIAAGTVKEGQSVPRSRAKKLGLTVWEWTDPPKAIPMDKLVLEQLRAAVKAEFDKEGDGATMTGGDYRLLDVEEELDRAWTEAKEGSKSVDDEGSNGKSSKSVEKSDEKSVSA